jgi:hypothetical protein
LFKKNVDHIKEWKLHEFPFSYYNPENILCNYNVVPFLSSVRRHNLGVFQRLCGCFQEMPWGSLGAHVLAQYQQNQNSPQEMFSLLGLPEEMFPMSSPFPPDFDLDSIDSWESFYKAKNYSFDNPAALVLEVPLTIWYLINKFHLKTAEPLSVGGIFL